MATETVAYDLSPPAYSRSQLRDPGFFALVRRVFLPRPALEWGDPGFDPDAARELADWLEARGDPRAGDLRELLAAQCVVPESPQFASDTVPMACGRWWSICLS